MEHNEGKGRNENWREQKVRRRERKKWKLDIEKRRMKGSRMGTGEEKDEMKLT